MRVETVCIYCGVGCKINLMARKGFVSGVLPSREGAGEGRLCIKGWSANEFIHHPERLRNPIIRTGNGFRKATWGEALDLVASKLMGIKESYGADSIGFFSSAKATNEENYLIQKLARAVIGTNNIDHCARLCHASTVTGLVSSFGSGAMTNSQEDVDKSNVIFLIGSNITEQHPLLARRLIKATKEGSKLIVADPRAIQIAEYSEIYLPIRPGSDVALLNAMMNVIIEEELQDDEFIEKRTEGFENLKYTVSKYPPEAIEEISGVSATDVRKAAILYGSAKNASIFFSMGITQHTTGVDNVVSIANLALLTGNIGRPGTGVNPLRGQNNVQGACDMGCLPDYAPGYSRIDEENTLKRIEGVWGSRLRNNPGLTLMEMIEAIGKNIRALFIMGENPVISDPNSNQTKKQLENLDFLIVSELFLSETAQMADVVLPAASFAEKEGTFTATDRRIQRVRKVIEPIGNCKPDWKIIMEICKRLGYPMYYSSPADIMEEIAKVTQIYGGISYHRLDREDLRWPCLSFEHPGTIILHENRFSRGRGLFHTIEYKPPAEKPDEDYPLILTTGRLHFHWHTGTMTRRSYTLTDQVNEACIEMNCKDAEKIGIGFGEKVMVSSRRGEITLRSKITDRIKEGVVFIPFHFAEAAANKLTNMALDPSAKIPELKVCAVSVNKISH